MYVSLEDIFQKNNAFYVNLSLQNKTYQQSRTGSHQAIFYKVRIKKAYPTKQPLGTFLLDFMNTSFYDYEDFTLFAIKYLIIFVLDQWNA